MDLDAVDGSSGEGLGRLMAALGASGESPTKPKRMQDHPKWAAVAETPMPSQLSFYYTNQQGVETYFDRMTVIKLDLSKLQFLLEGHMGDPLRFDLTKMTGTKNSQTGVSVQDLISDLCLIWHQTYKS